MPVNGAFPCKKLKNSSSENSEFSSCNSSSQEISEEDYDIWMCKFLDSFHDEIKTLQKNYVLDKPNYEDELIKFLASYNNLESEHFIRVGIYLNIEPNLVYARYLTIKHLKTPRI